MPVSTPKRNPGLGSTDNVDSSVLLPRQDRQWLQTPGLRMSGLCSPRPELRGARRKAGHMGAGDRGAVSLFILGL